MKKQITRALALAVGLCVAAIPTWTDGCYFSVHSAAVSVDQRAIIIKDRGLYLDFMMRVTAEAEDFRDFVESYWQLKQEARRHKEVLSGPKQRE